MEILNQIDISYHCDGCKKAHMLKAPLGSKIDQLSARISRHHRENSPTCPRDAAYLTAQRSYADEFNQHKATPHFLMGWRDADELDLTKEERKTPMIVIG
jgi:hypothetical protein